MGINLFIERNREPVAIAVKLPRSVSNTKSLFEVVRSLRSIERILTREWPFWADLYFPDKKEVQLLSFRVESPPEFKILTDPAWLVVFIAALSGYKGMKENVKEIHSDIRRFIDAIRGLTGDELQLLEIGIRLTLDELATHGEHYATALAKRFARVRAALLGDGEAAVPQIEVTKGENDSSRQQHV